MINFYIEFIISKLNSSTLQDGSLFLKNYI